MLHNLGGGRAGGIIGRLENILKVDNWGWNKWEVGKYNIDFTMNYLVKMSNQILSITSKAKELIVVV